MTNVPISNEEYFSRKEKRQQEYVFNLLNSFLESENSNKCEIIEDSDFLKNAEKNIDSYVPVPKKVNSHRGHSVQYATKFINPEYKHVLEFGVFEGFSLNLIRDSLDESYKVFGFDSFQGLPEDWVGTDCKKGHFTTNNFVPYIDKVKLFRGWFEDTIPDYLKEADTIGLLHIDCDLYSSTKTIFKYLHPYIKPGTIIVFDDWFYHVLVYSNDKPKSVRYADCEQKAFYEYVTKHHINWEFISFHDQHNPNERKIVRIL